MHPRSGRAYLNRARVRPGMAVPGGLLVRAFQSRRLVVAWPLDRLARLPAFLGDRR